MCTCTYTHINLYLLLGREVQGVRQDALGAGRFSGLSGDLASLHDPRLYPDPSGLGPGSAQGNTERSHVAEK